MNIDTDNSDLPRPRIFISYSRKDAGFIDRLEPALRARGFEPLIDRSEIYAFEDWWQRIKSLIAKADTIVFALSPDASASDVCAKEIAYAASLNKRFAPIVCRQVDDRKVPDALRRLNFIFFDDEARFEHSADRLAEALDTDIAWIRKHTEIGEHARRWDAAGRPGPDGLLLRPPILDEAEGWIAWRPRAAPEPTEETRAFVVASRAAFDEEKAQEQRRLAEIARSRVDLLAQVAEAEHLRANADTALRLAVHAVRQGRALPKDVIAPPHAAAVLAALVWQCDWRMLLSEHDAPVKCCAFSPQGSRILTFTASDYPDNSVRIWNAADGEKQLALRGHRGQVFWAAFHPDGSCVVASTVMGQSWIWAASTGAQMAVIDKSGGRHFAFSPDGKQIVTTWDSTARIRDAATGADVAVLRGHERRLYFASYSSDGARVVTASEDKTARIWDRATAQEIAVLRGHRAGVTCAAFSPDGSRIATASNDETARIWDATTGKEIAVLDGHNHAVEFCAFSPDGARIVTASRDKTARIWDAATGKALAVLRGHGAEVWVAAYDIDGSRVVTASSDNTARIWDTSSRTVLILSEFMACAAYSPDGSRIVTATRDTASVRDGASGDPIAVLRGHEGRVNCAAYSPDGTRIVTASRDRTARIWDAAAGAQVAVLRGHESEIGSASYSRDGKRLVTASHDGTARIWDAATGTEIVVLRGHHRLAAGQELDRRVNSASFSPDGLRIVTAAADKTARIWDAATGAVIAVLRGHGEMVNSAAFSPDGTRIVTGSGEQDIDNTARIWDASTGAEIAILRHQGSVNSVAFSPDGSRIVTASGGIGFDLDKTARIWDAATGKEIAVLRGHEEKVATASLSPDASRLVTTSWDKTVRIWDVRFATMSTEGLMTEVCTRRLRGATRLSRSEMRLAGYLETKSEIDVSLE